MLHLVLCGFRSCQCMGKLLISMRRFTRYLGALIVGSILLAMAPDAQAATCGGRNFVDRLNLTVAPRGVSIQAISSNGESYDSIASAPFQAKIDILLCSDGALDGIVLHLGNCTGHGRGCDSMPIMHREFPSARSLSRVREFSFAIPPNSALGAGILAKCNSLADEARGAQEDVAAGLFGMPVTLGVDTRRDPGVLSPTSPGLGPIEEGETGPSVDPFQTPLTEYSKTANFAPFIINVVCAPLPLAVKAPPKITEAAIGVTMAGGTCPKPATADVIIAAEEPRWVFYKIERGNGTTTTANWIKGRIKVQKGLTGGKSAFLRAEHDLGALDPGTRKFRLWIDGWGKTPWQTAEVDCPPFKVTSAWLKYDVEDKDTCPKTVKETATFKSTRPGKARFEIKTQGGLVVHSGEARFEREGMGYVAKVQRPNLVMNAFDQDMMALIKGQSDANSGWVRLKVGCVEAVSGTVTLKRLGATSCKGEALVAIHTIGAGEVPYELECGPGKSWQRNVTVQANNIGVDKLRFDVTNNERVTCVLRTRSGNALKSLDGASETFRCHKPVDVSGTTDLVPETRDDPQGPRNPVRVADPVRTCPAGTVGQWPRCRERACPRGTVGKWPKCKKQVCPRGTVGKWPKCKKRGCPPGQVRVRGRCIKPAG